MALSFIEVNPTSGGQSVYSNINLQFVSTNDIYVTIKKANGTVIELASDKYTVTTSPNLTVTITDSDISSAIATNDTIRIYRDTDVSSPARIYSNGSVLKASDLNANHNQILYAQQENDELGIGDALQKDASGAFWDATSLNIRNVADAVESSDAITLGQVNAALASAGSVPSVPQAWSTASGTLSGGNYAASNTTFSMTPPPTSEYEQTFIVEIDGVIQRPNNDYTVTTGTTEGTLTIIGGDVVSSSVVVTNFGLSRQVFDFPTTGQATTSDQTPITLQGHSSQSACIFLVEQHDGDDIFCVMNDQVKINGRGSTAALDVRQNTDGQTSIMTLRNAANQVVHHFKDPTEEGGGGSAFYEINDQNTVNAGNDHMLILRRTAVNDANNSERGAFFICKGNDGAANGGNGRDVFLIKQNGKVEIKATDDTVDGAEDNQAALVVRYQHAADEDPANYISCNSKSGIQRFALSATQMNIGTGTDELDMTVQIGRRDPTGDNLNQIRSYAVPSTDGSSGTANTVPYYRFILQGNKASNNRRGMCELNAMAQNSGEALLVRTVSSNSSNSKLIELNYDGNILIQDVVSGRTKGASSVLRKDEVAKAAGITLCTHNTNDTAITLATAAFGMSGSDGTAQGTSVTTDDTSTYTIASNNSQIAVSQSSGVITVGAGTFLATYSVDAEWGFTSAQTPNMDFELQLLKNGSVVATSKVDYNHESGIALMGEDGTRYISLNYSELITAGGTTTYQLRGKVTLQETTVGIGVRSPIIRTRQKSLLIHNLGES